MDPNKTIASGFDPNRTAAMGADPNRTAAMGAVDPMRTQAMAIIPDGPALSAKVIPGREATMANGPAREPILLELTASGMPGAAGTRTPMNLCLAIDRSGSMEGMPLEYVKQAVCHVVDLLSPDDVLSIVTFEETVELLMPPQRVTDRNAVKQGVQQIVAGNTTDLYGGISLALRQVLQGQESRRASRVLVLSDGDPTTGVRDYSALVEFAADVKKQGVSLTLLGFGPDYNEELLAGMAKKAGGNYYFIPQPQMIPEVFRVELQKLMTVTASNVTLHLKLARWVNLRSSHGQEPNAREATISLADMERGSTASIVFDFEFSNHPLGWYRVAGGTLSYDDANSGRRETADIDFVMEFTADQARYSAPLNPLVRSAADVALASRAVEKTIMGLKTHQLTTAAAVADLQKTQALLTAEGRLQEAQEVTMALRAIQSGDMGSAEKTLMGTMVNLDQGKRN